MLLNSLRFLSMYASIKFLSVCTVVFDSIIPSMRTSIIKNGRWGSTKWPSGSGKGYTPRFLALLSAFAKGSHPDHS